MFYYISGTVAHMEPYLAVIDCGGVGYACRTTTYTLASLKKGEPGKLYTYLNVREDAMELYGFATQEELNLFQQLISVSGVGPKAALSILSASTPANLALSIITGDEKALTCAQGIGKKIAQRVILELRTSSARARPSPLAEELSPARRSPFSPTTSSPRPLPPWQCWAIHRARLILPLRTSTLRSLWNRSSVRLSRKW